MAYRGPSKEACEAWIAKKRRSFITENPKLPQAVIDIARKNAEKRAAYRIVPPEDAKE